MSNANLLPVFHKTEADLFSTPPIQSSVVDGKWVTHTPINTLPGCNHVEFNIKGEGSDYVDLNSSFVRLVVKVTDSRDGTNIDGQCQVAGVNNFLHSMFNNVSLLLNDVPVTQSNVNYAYRSYLTKVLSYGAEAGKSYLQSEGFFKDTAGHMDTLAVGNNYPNKGYKSRKELVSESREVELKGRLHVDMFQQGRLLMNGVNIKLVLYRSPDDFCLIGQAVNAQGQHDWEKTTFGVEILEAYLDLRKVTLTPTMALQHVEALNTQTAKYPIKRVVPRTYNIAAGRKNHTERGLFTGQLPTRLTIALVDNEAYNGVITRNPFNFHHHNCNSISLMVDGKAIPVSPMQMDFPRGKYMDAFLGLAVNTGQYGSDEGNMIHRNDFGKGYAVYVFNLKPDLDAEEEHISSFNRGDVDISLTFSTEIQHTLTVITMAEFDNTIEIDRFRQVTMDY